ncbi:hypothetical protein DIPPA_08532 [Diplonema papillatum]|nr:hypothetical protein DIPPA_08532 [Diplonema papillatum]
MNVNNQMFKTVQHAVDEYDQEKTDQGSVELILSHEKNKQGINFKGKEVEGEVGAIASNTDELTRYFVIHLTKPSRDHKIPIIQQWSALYEVLAYPLTIPSFNYNPADRAKA